jgi:hypothetical protein
MLVPVLGFSVCVKDVFYQSFPIDRRSNSEDSRVGFGCSSYKDWDSQEMQAFLMCMGLMTISWQWFQLLSLQSSSFFPYPLRYVFTPLPLHESFCDSY